MKVICKKTTSEGFDLKNVQTISSNDFDYSFGGNGYGIEIFKEYIVLSILSYKNSNCLYYLIDINGKPYWFPYLLFDISDNKISNDWFIKLNDDDPDSDVMYIYGFKELCNDPQFYDRLLDRDYNTGLVYTKRKIETEIKNAIKD